MKKESPSYFTEEVFEKNANSAFQWFNQTARLMSESYKRQLLSSYEVFNTFFESTLNSVRNSFESESNSMVFSQKNMNMFIKNLHMYSDLSKEVMKKTMDSMKTKDGYLMVNEGYFDAIYHAFNNQAKHMASINQNFMDIYNQYFKSMQFDYEGFLKNYSKQMEANMTSSNNSFKTMLHTFEDFKMMPDSSGNKMAEEINKQIDNLAKSNISFWNDLYSAFSKQTEESHKTDQKEEAKSSAVSKRQLVNS